MQQTQTTQTNEVNQTGSFNPTVESFTTGQKELLQILKSINSVLENDATISLSNEGLSFRSLDSSHVSLIDMRLSSNIFEKFDITKDQKIGFNVHEFLRIVKTLNNKKSIKVEILTDKIRVSQQDLVLDLVTLEASVNDCPIPKIPYDAMFKASAKFLKGIINKAASVGDYITIETFNHYVKFSSKGDNGEYQEDIFKESFEDLKIREDSITTYSIEYLKEFLKTLGPMDSIDFEYLSRNPCRLTTRLNNIGMIQYYLAPRVEN